MMAQYLVINHPLVCSAGGRRKLFDLQDRAGVAADFAQQQERIRLRRTF